MFLWAVAAYPLERVAQRESSAVSDLVGDDGLPVLEAEWLAELFSTLLDGHNAFTADGVRRVLGREPRDFAEFARDAAAAGDWQG